MLRDRWRFWLAALMLIALPLKTLAAVGVVLCCPPVTMSAASVQAIALMADHAEHEAQSLAVSTVDHASGHDAATNGGAHAHDGADSGAKHVPCCGAAALTAAVMRLPLPLDQRGERLMPLAERYASADLAGRDKPPRS